MALGGGWLNSHDASTCRYLFGPKVGGKRERHSPREHNETGLLRLGRISIFFLSLSIDISMFISISNLYVHKHTYTHTFFLEQFRQVLVVGTPTPLPTFAPAGGETPGGTTQGETPVPGTLSGDRPKIILPDESDKLYSNICFF